MVERHPRAAQVSAGNAERTGRLEWFHGAPNRFYSLHVVSSAPTSVLDDAALQSLRELDPDDRGRLLERVFKAFETSVARLRPRLHEAGGNADTATVKLVVHTLKSSSASIGAVRLSQLCGEAEADIRRGDLAALPGLIVAIDRELDGVLQALRAMQGATT